MSDKRREPCLIHATASEKSGGWVAGRTATHVVQVVHCPNLDL